MNELLRRAVEVDATVARYGSEFAVLRPGIRRRRAAADPAGPRRRLRRTSSCRCPARTRPTNAALALAAVEAFFGAGAGKQLDIAAVQDGFAAVASPGRLERVADLADDSGRRRAQPARGCGAGRGAGRRVLVLPAGRGAGGDGGQGRRRHPRARWSTPSTRSSSPRTRRPDRCRSTELAAIADDVFGARAGAPAGADGRGDRPGRRPRRGGGARRAPAPAW